MKRESYLLDSEPRILRDQFLALRTPHDVAEMLKIDYRTLDLYIYKIPPERRYITFSLPKRSAGVRTISVPFKGLKFVQWRLAQVLSEIYAPEPWIHGYVRNRSILTNARVHARKRYVLNIDISDFFPSINFGRVRGLFIHRYSLDHRAATVLAQICCHNNELPQGAPTSPVVSNLICSRMDKELANLASRHDCSYSRYADDITLSTNEHYFPAQLARPNARVKQPISIKIGEELRDIIEDNGFRIRSQKARLQTEKQRQIVTGLVVNIAPNVKRKFVRQIRAMLHAWQKHGYEAAEKEHFEIYAVKYRGPFSVEKPSYREIVRGKIAFLGMVKGKQDPVYVKHWNQLVQLDPNTGELLNASIDKEPLVFTEGETDPRHLKAALASLRREGRFRSLAVRFNQESGASGGHDQLLKMCESLSKAPNPAARIFIFDRDVPSHVRERVSGGKGSSEYRSWGNNVFSFLLPVPSHRVEDRNGVCIELFYTDKDLMTEDAQGRRLFLNREFHNWARHKHLPLTCPALNKVRSKHLAIIDSEVIEDPKGTDVDEVGKNVALAKSEFAINVEQGRRPFDDMDFSEFAKVFEVIENIVATSSPSNRS